MEKDKLYLKHILTAIDDIETYISRTDFENFSKNKLLQDGVMRKLEIIGEASKRLSDDFRNSTSEIPWKDICGMRDKLIHDYIGVDIMAVWKTAIEDTKILKQKIGEATDLNYPVG